MHSLVRPLVVKWMRFETIKSEVLRSIPAHQLFLNFQPKNILRFNLNLSTSYGRSTD